MNPACLPSDCTSLKRSLRTAFFAITLTAIGVNLVGYSDRADAGTNSTAIAGSCNNTAMGFCNEFTGSSYIAAKVQRSCASQKVQYVPGACPAESRIGTCLVYKGKNTESNYVYYTNFPGMRLRGGATVATEAAKQCAQLKGEWHLN